MAFDVNFTATTLLEANPPLDQLALSDVFGSGDLSLGWVPGKDRVYILASGAGGSARCLADDTSGSFSLPRSVITQVLGAQGSTALALSIERMHLDRHQDVKTIGSLSDRTIQPQAWLDLVTTSTETISLQACKTSETSCGNKCVDTQTDANNCGSCGNACSGGVCVAGSCQTSTGGSCSSCQLQARSTLCGSSYAQCTGECQTLLACVTACNGNKTCGNSCMTTYSQAVPAFQSYWTCMCVDACPTQCSLVCSG